MSKVLDEIKKGYLFFDGGYGTIFQTKGLKPGELPEVWNITKPEVIKEVHKAYLDAGANIIKTNTFGANAFKFGQGVCEYSLEEIIKAAINNVKSAIAETDNLIPRFTALDIGSLGKLLKPLGNLEFEDAVDIFKEIVTIGKNNGADLILIETMNDIYEAKAAILAAKEASDLPIFLTTAYDENGKLLTGADPKTVVTIAEGLGVDAIGVNCSLGPVQMKPIVKEICDYASVPVICNPNAGLPRTENGKTVFDVNPKMFSEAMTEIAGYGVRIFGGCCGTTPQHIEVMRNAVSQTVPLEITEKNHALVCSYTHSVEFKDKLVLIGERINPTGKKKFKEALRNNDMDYILQEGIKQQDNGADVLDVNVGLPEIDEPLMMLNVVKELQSISDLPLQIDTTDKDAMEKALRIYNGKAMVNSVNGKKEVMDMVFPLVQKYGGVLIALTIDENGIPESAEGRVSIAENIINKASEYGIKKKDIIVDPLCMSISSDSKSALVTLKALQMLKDRGIKTSLGVSNISFGLPEREFINSTFFTMSLLCGLNAAIMNPNSFEMMKAYKSYNALANLDENCGDYIEYATTVEKPQAVSKNENTDSKGNSVVNVNSSADENPLIKAITKGMKDKAAVLTKEYLKEIDSLKIIDNYIIPALDIVGKGFENKTMFLPQLLMSAEAASSSFDEIRNYMLENGSKKESKGKIVLATVKGDIHDIGKNIVKTLLENYGYDVIDLGKDVEPEVIVNVTRENNIKMVGLSALMTTTVPAMEETIKLLRKECKEIKVCVGGAVLTQEYADMIGADKYAKDAMETVRYAEELFS